jgi:hypothetical protein
VREVARDRLEGGGEQFHHGMPVQRPAPVDEEGNPVVVEVGAYIVFVVAQIGGDDGDVTISVVLVLDEAAHLGGNTLDLVAQIRRCAETDGIAGLRRLRLEVEKGSFEMS